MIATRTESLPRQIAGCLTALGAVVALGLSRPAVATESYSEDSVKAAFIYRFAGYVEWPKAIESGQSFNIAVMGANDIVLRLQTLVVDRTLHNRPIKVRKITSMRDAADAHILYIGPEHRSDLRNLLLQVGSRDMLIVTDEEHGLEAGSTINFLMVDHRVRFEMSVDAARRAGLTVSSELLSVAVRVQGGRGK